MPPQKVSTNDDANIADVKLSSKIYTLGKIEYIQQNQLLKCILEESFL